MKKTALLLLLIAVALAAASQNNIPLQELHYDAHYHCGLINVKIGHAKVAITRKGDKFHATFNGHTIPWGGRVYCVSDTLNAVFTPDTPYSRGAVTYVNGWYMKPKESVFNGGNFNPSNPKNYKTIKGKGQLSASPQTMEAITIAADMLGLYHYYREIDFDRMSEGDQITIPIAVKGGKDQSVTITYNGKSQVEHDGVNRHTYSTVYEFTYGGVPSGYPVKTEVAVDSRLPVSMSASLPIGKVELFLR